MAHFVDTAETNAADEIPLETLSKQGKAPNERLTDPQKAGQAVWQLIESNEARLRKQAMIKGMFDGNPPYDQTKLEQHGQGNRSNFSTLEGKAKLSSALTPFYDLFNASNTYAEITVDEKVDAEKATEWSRILTDEFDRMLKAYPNFNKQLWAGLHDYVGFNKMFMMWADDHDWRPTRIRFDRVLVPDGTDVDLEDLEFFIVRQKFPTTRLFRMGGRDTKAARENGWNPNAVQKAIRRAVPDSSHSGEYWQNQREILDQDLLTNIRSSVVESSWIYVREFDNTWSRYLIDEHAPHKEQDWLLRQPNKYKDITRALAPFFHELLEGSWNAPRGLGKDIFNFMKIKDRMRNAQVDNVFLQSSVLLQAQTPQAVQKLNLVQIGNATVIPPDFQVQQSSILGDISSTLQVNRDLDLTIERNTGIFQPRLDQPSGNPRTATEISLQFQQSTVLTNSAVNRFYDQLDPFYAEVYRRAVSDERSKGAGEGARLAREFRKRAKDRGVPERVMKNAEVRARRAIGNGSQFQRQQTLTQLAQFMPSFTEGGRQNLKEDIVGALAGNQAIGRYMPETRENDQMSDHHWVAMVENDSLRNGMPIPILDQHNPVIHAQVHIQAMAQAASSLQQGADPSEVLRFLDTGGPHVAEHLRAFAGDENRKQEFELLNGQWKQLSQLADSIREQVQEEIQRQAQQNQGQELDPEQVRKQQEFRQKMAQDAAKFQMEIQQRQQRFQQEQKLREAQTLNQIRRQTEQDQARLTQEEQSQNQ